MNHASIRKARPDDIDAIAALCVAHARFEKAKTVDNIDAKSLAFHIFNSKILGCLVVEIDANIVGYATYIKQFSTWDTTFYLYLDCLYLRESARGIGLGKRLMQEIKMKADSLNCKSVQWQTPIFNKEAIGFYHKLKAGSTTKERFIWE